MNQEIQFQKLLGEIISSARLEKGMTQKELGMKIGYINNSAGQVIHKIEEGKISIPKKKIHILLETLGITHEKLGIEPSVSLPMWIASQGKKGEGRSSLRELISTAGAIASGVVGISETVASGVIDISETIVTGMAELSETVVSGVSNASSSTRRDKEKQPMKYSDNEKLKALETLCGEDQEKLEKARELFGL